MPIQVRYRNDPAQECVIRPTPFMSISSEVLKTGAGETFGITYTITLNGTLLEDQGFPFAKDTSVGTGYGRTFNWIGTHPGGYDEKGPYGSFDVGWSHAVQPDGMNRQPRKQLITNNKKLGASLFKQKALRGLFAIDGQRVEISSVDYNEPAIIIYPRLVDISFDEGPYVNKCDYTIVLETDTLLTKEFRVDDDGNPLALQHTTVGHHELIGSDEA